MASKSRVGSRELGGEASGPGGRLGLRVWALGAVAWIVALTVCAGAAWAKSYRLPLVEVSFRLLSDGDAEVEEVRTFRFEGSFTWAEIRRSTRGRYGVHGIRYRGVWDADTEEPLAFTQRTEGEEVVLRWTYQAQDTTRRFRIRYRIEQALQRYADVAQFYWQAVEGDHAPIDRVRIRILLPQPSPGLFKVFVHSRTEPGTLNIPPDAKSTEVELRRVPETSFVEVRVLLDPAVFPAAPLRSGETRESLLADERRQAQEAVRRGFGDLAMVGGSVLLALGLVAAYVWTYLRYGREPAVPYEGLYEREPPRPVPPAVVSAILSQSRARPENLARGFAATLLEAARVGYVEIEERESRGVLGLVRDTDLVYRLTDRGRALLEGRPVEVGPRERPLEPFEGEVLHVVFRRAGSGGEVTSDQLEAWGKRMSGKKSNFLRFAEGWGTTLRGWFEERYFPLDDPTSEAARNVFVLVLFGVVFLSFALLRSGWWVLPAVVTPVGLLLMGLAAKGLPRRTPEAALEVKRWEAFRGFLADFSAMKDGGPVLLRLWEKYLVYATALGVAEKLLENLKLVAVERDEAPPRARWFRASSGREGVAGNLASLDSLARSFQNFHALSRALASSSGTGGGFSRGGGGGGGGGSSRAG
jgi:uncharacterized membrane protein